MRLTPKEKPTMIRKRPKSLDAPVVNKAIQLEIWAYTRCDQWKRSYRYTLVNEFRQHITAAKNEIITAFELQARLRNEKLYHYSRAITELSIVESNMDIMIHDNFNVMSEKEWEDCAEKIDGIRDGLSRLINSLTKSASGSESPNFGTGSASADYKDA